MKLSRVITVSLSDRLPSAFSHLPAAFFTSKVRAPAFSSSVTFRPSTDFVITSLPFFASASYSSFRSIVDVASSLTSAVPDVTLLSFRT